MPKKLTGNKTQQIQIGDIKGSEMIVDFDYKIKKNQIREEDFHGTHQFNEDETEYEINSVAIVLCGIEMARFLPSQLSKKQLSSIEDVLSIYE